MNHQKILYITPELTEGGAEKFLILLSNSLINETKKQIVVSLSGVNLLKSELNAKIDFTALARKYKLDIKQILKLRELIRSEKPDLIFCINFYSYFICLCATLWLNIKCSKLVSYHNTMPENRKEYILHKLYFLLFKKKDSIITVSANQALYTAQKYNIPLNRFTTIHNGIDTNYWCPAKNDADRNLIRAAYDIPTISTVIVIVAALRVEKNHIGAVKALQLLHKKYRQEAYLLIVGDGIMREEITNLANELKISAYIRITGMQSDVRPFYRASDIFTLCSNTEAFSVAAIEAMGCGLPCVLTNVGGADEMIKDNVNGFVCSINENDIALTWSKALNREFSKKQIHDYARDNFSSEKMLTEYKKIFEQKERTSGVKKQFD